jgi:hypothetical protein
MSTIKAKLLMLVFVLSSVAIIVALMGLSGMRECNSEFKDVYDNRIVPLNQLKVVADMYAVDIVDTTHKARNGNLTPQEAISNIHQAQEKIAKEWGAYAATKLTPEEATLAKEAKERFVIADKGVEKVLGLLESGNLEGVAEFSIKELYPNIDPISETIGKLVERTQKSLGESNATVSIIVQSVTDATEMMSNSALEIKRLGEHAQGVEHIMSQSVREIAAAVEHLAKLSEGLSHTLAQFKTA